MSAVKHLSVTLPCSARVQSSAIRQLTDTCNLQYVGRLSKTHAHNSVLKVLNRQYWLDTVHKHSALSKKLLMQDVKTTESLVKNVVNPSMSYHFTQ